MLRRILPVVFTLVLVAAACGSDSSDRPDDVSIGDGPSVASICEEGVDDCDDAVQPGGADDAEPGSADGGPVANSGSLVNGGLSVEEALSTDAGGILAVKGFLVADETTIWLCSALAESFPPQCGGAALVVDAPGVDALTFDEQTPLLTEQGVAWTDQTIVLFGELVDGVLVVDPLVAG